MLLFLRLFVINAGTKGSMGNDLGSTAKVQKEEKVKRFQFNDKHFCQKKASVTRDKLEGGRESSFV